MIKLAIVGTIAVCVQAGRVSLNRVSEMREHPINEDTVNHVKRFAETWTPLEVHENPLAKLSLSQLHGLLGT